VETSIYNKKSHYYDFIYSWKNYKTESIILEQLIKKYKRSSGSELLDAGCGTGSHLEHLQDTFSVMGIDISDCLLKEAKIKNPNIQFRQCDFIQVNFAKKYDVILCLGNSIGYTKNYHNLQKTIKSFSKHLNPGGLLLIEPWFQEQYYHDNSSLIKTYHHDDIKIARLTEFRKKGIVSLVNMHFLLSEAGKTVQHWDELHEIAMFDKNDYLQLMTENGLESTYVENGLISSDAHSKKPASWYESDKGLYIGIKSI